MIHTYSKILVWAGFLSILGITYSWWWHNNGSALQSYSGAMIAIGRFAGTTAALGALTQLLLMAKITFIEQLFSFELFLKIHKYTGYTVLGSLIVHPIFLVLGYRLNGQPGLFTQFSDFILHYEDVLKALIASLLFITIVISSIAIVRLKLRYETWYIVHISSYVAVLLAFGHQIHAGGDFVGHPLTVAYWYSLYFIVFGWVAYSRFLRPFLVSFRHQLRVDRVVQETHDTYSVYVTGRNLHVLRAQAGQFFNWRFLTMSRCLQAHPFSLSASPNDTTLRFTYKVLGDYTKQLHHLTVGTRVVLEGPHGSFTLRKAQADDLLLIGGGVGITPLRALLDELPLHKRATVLYCARTNEDFVFKREFQKFAENSNVTISLIATNTHGRITKEHLERYLTNRVSTDVFLCGPMKMMHQLERTLLELGVAKRAIHYEGFTY